MRILAPSDPSKAAVALQLELGRIVLSRIVSADQPASEPIRVQLRVHDRDWLIELPASEARVGFDVTPVPPVRLEKTYDGFPYKVWAAGSRGAVRIHPPEGEPREIGAEDTVALAGPGPGEVLVEPGTTIEQFLVQKDPALLWMSGPTAPTDKRDAMRFAREFDPSDPVSDTMPSLVTHERAWMSRRAVQCLALTEDYRALVRSLNVAEHEEAVEAAIRGLRHWLPLDPENGPRLREALEQEFTADEAEILYRLLWGFDEEHGRDPRTSQELVSWLSHDRLAIRRLAYFHILRLTGQQDEYRLLMSDDRMQSFRKRWERHLERHKALLETTAD